jgi:succinate-acetate transporter protein
METKLANPAPLGFLGLGLAIVLLNIPSAGIFPLGAMLPAMGVFCGGIAQIIAGLMEFKKGNTFGTTAFTFYGLFWLSLVATWIVPGLNSPAGGKTPEAAMSWYFALWGLVTFFMWCGTFGKNRVLQLVFLSLTLWFALLAAREWTDSALIGTIAGWEGIVCGLSAIYLAVAEVLNEGKGRPVLPIGESRM